MKGQFNLDKDKRKYLLEKIKKFFSEERDEDIGDLAADLYLEFIIKNIANEFYNQGIKDAAAYMSEKVEDMYGLER